MATLAALDVVQAWLISLRCPRAIDASFDPEFIDSLAFLSQRALGRRAVSHVRKEIHRLRTVSKVNLSVPTRQLLGLDIVESSNKALDRLQIDHTRSQDALQIALAESKQIAKSDGRLLERLLDHQLLSARLSNQVESSSRSQIQINGLVKLLLAHSEASDTPERSIATQVAEYIQQLQSGEATLILDGSPRLTLDGLLELAELQRKMEEQLDDLVERKRRFTAPAVDVLDSKLFGIRSRCVDKSTRIQETLPRSDKDEPASRQELLDAISASRARQASMELEIDKADNPVSVPAASSTQHEIDILENDLTTKRSEIQSLLGLRLELQTLIRNLLSSIAQQNIATLAARLDATATTSCSILNRNLDDVKSELASLLVPSTDDSTKLVNPSTEDRRLFADGVQALYISHLLATRPARPLLLAQSEIDASFKLAAELRQSLESFRPRLEEAISYTFASEELEESNRQRKLLISGQLLPPSRDKDGVSLQERWRKSEREIARAEKVKK